MLLLSSEKEMSGGINYTPFRRTEATLPTLALDSKVNNEYSKLGAY
jgi:hypothetical protein